MSKRKQPAAERRRPHVEINLLAEDDDRGGGHISTRRGCSLPFFGGVLGAWLLPLGLLLLRGVLT